MHLKTIAFASLLGLSLFSGSPSAEARDRYRGDCRDERSRHSEWYGYRRHYVNRCEDVHRKYSYHSRWHHHHCDDERRPVIAFTWRR